MRNESEWLEEQKGRKRMGKEPEAMVYKSSDGRAGQAGERSGRKYGDLRHLNECIGDQSRERTGENVCSGKKRKPSGN